MPRKPLPGKAVIAAGAAVAAACLWGIGVAIISGLSNPQQNLARIARQVAAGPKNPADSRAMSQSFDRCLRSYLAKAGNVPAAVIVEQLKKLLPAAAFEVHYLELPRGLTIVEVDTVLQGSNYLLMKGSSRANVFPLAGLEVLDDARLINASSGPMLVAIGHSGGQPPHRPQVKVYALLPDNLSDETSKLLPPLSGQGCARFAGGGDLIVELSLLSLAQSKHLFAAVPQSEDATITEKLTWKDARYISSYKYGSSPFAALYVVASCLRNPDLGASYKQYLGAKGEQLVRENHSESAGNFQVKQLPGNGQRLAYLLSGSTGSFFVDLAKANGLWSVVDARSNQISASASESKTVPASESAASAYATSKSADKTKVKTIENHEKTSKTQATRSSVIGQGIVNSAGTINLRSGPNTNTKPVTAIARGAAVEIIGKEKGWYQVRYQNQAGYIYAGLIDCKRPDAYTTATVTKIRPIRDSHKQPLGQPQAGDRVVILGGLENNKYKVQLANGQTGYLDKDALNVKIDEPQFVP